MSNYNHYLFQILNARESSTEQKILTTVQVFAIDSKDALNELSAFLLQDQYKDHVKQASYLEWVSSSKESSNNIKTLLQVVAPVRNPKKPIVLQLVESASSSSYKIESSSSVNPDSSSTPYFIGFTKPYTDVDSARPYLYLDERTGDVKCSKPDLTWPYHAIYQNKKGTWFSMDRSSNKGDLDPLPEAPSEGKVTEVRISIPTPINVPSQQDDGKPIIIEWNGTSLYFDQGIVAIGEQTPKNVSLPLLAPRYVHPLPVRPDMFDQYVCTFQSPGNSDVHYVVHEHKHGALLFMISEGMLVARIELLPVSEDEVKFAKQQPRVHLSICPMISIDIHGRVLFQTTVDKWYRCKYQFPRVNGYTAPLQEIEYDGSLVFDVRVFPDPSDPTNKEKQRRVRVGRFQVEPMHTVDEAALATLLKS